MMKGNRIRIILLAQALLLALSAARNPFQGRKLYLRDQFADNLRRTIRVSSAGDKALLKPLIRVPTAKWLANRASIRFPGPIPYVNYTMLAMLRDAATMRPVPLTTFVVYNLPNRDCSARASVGELCCLKFPDGSCNHAGSRECSGGLRKYRREYIDEIAKYAKRYCSRVPMVFIIEPDALPNLVTNLAKPKCASAGTQESYRMGIKYAVNKLHGSCRQATLYIGAGHGAWLGWDTGSRGFANEIARLGIARKIRGFATNIAGYQPMGTICPFPGFCNGGANSGNRCCKDDPCGLTLQYNPGFSELNFVEQLAEKVSARIRGFSPRFVIDTGRNGVPDTRSTCSNFCNIRKAGLGLRPTTRTASSLIDAYLWIKTPGESDGCSRVLPSGRTCPRFELACASSDSIGTKRGEPRVPDAGKWFSYHILQLARRGI